MPTTKRRVVIMKAVEIAPAPFIEMDIESKSMNFIDDISWLSQKATKQLMLTGRVVAARK